MENLNEVKPAAPTPAPAPTPTPAAAQKDYWADAWANRGV